ncbi:MAG: GyrI-like domain-containing protein [Ghiorsea sp.]|nr:GyrI-like domain-containing protein [Ghiorsea sp.]
MRIDIVNIKAIKVAALEHVGEPEKLEESVEVFRAWRKESGCSPVTEKRTFGVAHSNPEAKPVQAFHFDICGEVDADVPTNEYGVVNKEISAGRCARLRHIGSHDNLQMKVNALYRVWLTNSNEAKRDAPIFFEYLNAMPEVVESKLITDIYLPLKEA